MSKAEQLKNEQDQAQFRPAGELVAFINVKNEISLCIDESVLTPEQAIALANFIKNGLNNS